MIFLLPQGPENIVFNAAIIPTNRFLQEQFQDHHFFPTPYADHEQDAQCYDKKLSVKSPTEVMLDFMIDYSTEEIKNAFPEHCPHYSPCLSVRFRLTIIFDKDQLQVNTHVDFHPWHHTLVDAFKKIPTTPAVAPLKIPITFSPALDSSVPYLNLREHSKTPPRHPTPSPRKRPPPSPATALSHLQITPSTTQASRQVKPASAPSTPSRLFSSQPKRVAIGTSRALFTPAPGLPPPS